MLSTSINTPAIQDASKVHLTTLITVTWVVFSLSTGFVVFRTVVRLKILRKFFVDDALIVFAWIMTLVNVVLCQWIGEGMYIDNAMTAQLLMPTPEIITKEEQWLKVDAAQLILFYSSLWAVKLSFLLFFRRLYYQIRWLRIYWLIVLTVTVATWIVCVGTIPYHCLIPSFEETIQDCSTEEMVEYDRHTLYANMAIDLFSDLLIISIPLSVLWCVQISRGRKAILGAIFSLTVITMIVAVIRAALVTTGTTAHLDAPWVVLWSLIEQCIAIIVACLAFFKTLFTDGQTRPAPPQCRQYSSERRKLKGFQNVTELISELAKTESLKSELETSLDSHDNKIGLARLERNDVPKDQV